MEINLYISRTIRTHFDGILINEALLSSFKIPGNHLELYNQVGLL